MKEKIFVNKIEEVMNTAMENLKPLVDSNIVVGKTIVSGSVSIIPLTKVTLGFVSGGGEYNSELKEMRKDNEYPFSGGAGGGVSLKPVGFLIIKHESVELIKMEQTGAIDKLIEAIPEVAKFISKNFGDGNK